MSYYAVKAGRCPGVYKTWNECKAQVHGFSGAVYKKFDNKQDAEEFVKDSSDKNLKSVEELLTSDSTCVAYVDGSYNQEIKKYGYGIILLFADGDREEMSGSGNGGAASMRNVAGEIQASMLAVNAAVVLGMEKIIVCHDYTGIRNWALGEWNANNEYTQEYQKFMRNAMKKIRIEFKKVAAHTGEKYNEEVDLIAKKACGVI